MSDNISRNAATEAVLELNTDGRVSWKDAVIDMLDALPSADAVQGEWIITKEGEYDGRSVYKTVCSECGHETFYEAYKAHFCPNCGARMYKGGDDE